MSRKVPSQAKKASHTMTWVLVAVVVALAAAPLILIRDTEFSGADNAAQDAISTIDPDAQPWFKPLWSPPSEVSTFLFSLQAAIGAGIIGYYFGVKRGQQRRVDH